MKKYLFIFKTRLMSNLQYIFDIFVGFIGYFIMFFIFLNLWNYMYSDSNEIINGYTMSEMIWYVVITEILWMSLGGRKLCKNICKDVRSGTIAYNLTKPYSYIGYIMSDHFGEISIKFIAYTFLGLLCGRLFLGGFPTLPILGIVPLLVTAFLATAISILLITCIGLLSFFIEDAHPFYWIYSKFILVLGTIFPIEYFPGFIQPFMKYSPIYVVSYGPAKLFVNFTWDGFLKIVVAQVIYLIICYGICLLIYKKGVKNLNVNGG